MKNKKHVVIFYQDGRFEDTCDYSHDMLRVTLSDGKMYAFDISSAQYGYLQPVTPWAQYESQRIDKIHSISPLGDMNKKMANNTFKFSPPGVNVTKWHGTVSESLNGFFANSVDMMKAASPKQECDMPFWLCVSEKTFEQRLKAFTGMIAEYLVEIQKGIKTRPIAKPNVKTNVKPDGAPKGWACINFDNLVI